MRGGWSWLQFLFLPPLCFHQAPSNIIIRCMHRYADTPIHLFNFFHILLSRFLHTAALGNLDNRGGHIVKGLVCASEGFTSSPGSLVAGKLCRKRGMSSVWVHPTGYKISHPMGWGMVTTEPEQLHLKDEPMQEPLICIRALQSVLFSTGYVKKKAKTI